MADYIMDPGSPGGQANMVPATFISRNAEGTIVAGSVVENGTEDRSCLAAGTASPTLPAEVLGIATNGGAEYDAIRVATHGCFWVDTAGGVVPGDAVKYDSGTGKWGKTGDITVTSAKWDSSAPSAGGLATVRLNGFAVTV